jgi:hypothetical protein
MHIYLATTEGMLENLEPLKWVNYKMRLMMMMMIQFLFINAPTEEPKIQLRNENTSK